MIEYKKLKKMYAETKKKVKYFYFGKSEWGQKLCCFELGTGDECIILQGELHAREYITSFLLLKMINYLNNFVLPIKVLVVPMMNPDGLDMCLKGKKVLKNCKKYKDFAKNYETVKFVLDRCDNSLIKCNGRGVDLNVNFDCDFGQGKHNFFGFPDFQNYVGESPNSESETKALIRLTKKYNPFLTLSFHSKGEVIYFGYKGQSQKAKIEQRKYLKCLKDIHYKKYFTRNSCGGYKDYCIMNLNIPAFTIEVGNDNIPHPIKSCNLDKIFSQNKNIVLKLIKTKLKDNLCKKIL